MHILYTVGGVILYMGIYKYLYIMTQPLFKCIELALEIVTQPRKK
jgi:hypothetical protein